MITTPVVVAVTLAAHPVSGGTVIEPDRGAASDGEPPRGFHALFELVSENLRVDRSLAGVEESASREDIDEREADHALLETIQLAPLLTRPNEDQVVGTDQVVPPVLPRASLRGLSPDFAARLSRVAQRLWQEHGLRLDVIEGYRDQARQEALFAQGRTAPGPVVTWTRTSLHTLGRAADVYLDGAPVTAEGAAILARIAREEGLVTLYPFDSGHIQSADAGERQPEGPLARAVPAPTGVRPAPGARGVAPAAPVAPPAPVASPARPAASAEPPFRALPSGLEPTSRLEAGPVDVLADPRRDVVDDTDVDATRPMTESPGIESPGLERARSIAPHAPGTLPIAPRGQGILERGTLSSDAAVGSEAAWVAASHPEPGFDPERPAEVVRLRIPVDGMEGGGAIQVRLRGKTIDAHVNIGDLEIADRLRSEMSDLRLRLERLGAEPGELSVTAAFAHPVERSAAPPTEGDGRLHRWNTSADRWDRDELRSRLERSPDLVGDQRRGNRSRRDPSHQDLE
jgi:hypothetical protein